MMVPVSQERDAAEARVVVEGEQHDAGDEQEFIRKRVEDGPQFTALIVVARDVAIHAVANGGNGEGERGQEAERFRCRF